MSIIGIVITFVLVKNFILNQFLGLCPFIGVSKNPEQALGMGFAVTFVMAIASLATWAINTYILVFFNIEFLRTISFIIVIASLVQLVEMFIRKFSPPLYRALGIYLPLITTNCAVLGIALIAVQNEYNAIESFVAGLAAGLGFLLAITVMAGLRETIDKAPVPRLLRGPAIAFITGGLMAMAFMAFDQSLLNNLLG